MGAWAAWASRCVIATVFAVAAWGKLVDQAWTRSAVVALVPVRGRVAVYLGRLVPATEAVVAVAILPRATAPWAAGLAVALLAAFTVVIIAALARGRRPVCACFGSVSDDPIGARSVIRNLALAAVAAVALAGARHYRGAALPASQALTVAALAGLGAVALRQGAELRELRRRLPSPRRYGLDVGAPAPEFDLATIDGSRQSLAGLLAPGLPVALVFVHVTCGSCLELAEELDGWRRGRAGELTIALISTGTVEDNRIWEAEYGIGDALLQRGDEVAEQYRCHGNPNAVLISPDGRIARPLAVGLTEIRELLAS
ncbi:MAG TPA: MauE/DoxX family redox-associated membrane protein [Acidimicrobiales bacterium]|nr:MauE/DoxX family redox-associated membrane protein [Acidimicrobiales bacterium]